MFLGVVPQLPLCWGMLCCSDLASVFLCARYSVDIDTACIDCQDQTNASVPQVTQRVEPIGWWIGTIFLIEAYESNVGSLYHCCYYCIDIWKLMKLRICIYHGIDTNKLILFLFYVNEHLSVTCIIPLWWENDYHEIMFTNSHNNIWTEK